jgi:hypothetical protein
MGNTRSLRRKLNAEKVFIAEQVAQKRTELVKKFVEERVKKDAEFASDVLKAVGDALPENIKKLAEETIKNGPGQVDNETPIVKKWEKTGLFGPDTDPSLMTPIVESQAKELLIDGTLSKLTDDIVKGKLQHANKVNSNVGRTYPLKTP